MGNLGEIIFAGSIQLQTAVEFLCYFLIAADFFLCKEAQGNILLFFFQKDLLSCVNDSLTGMVFLLNFTDILGQILEKWFLGWVFFFCISNLLNYNRRCI